MLIIDGFWTLRGFERKADGTWRRKAWTEVPSLSRNSNENFGRPLNSQPLWNGDNVSCRAASEWLEKLYGNKLWLSTSFMNCKLPYTYKAFVTYSLIHQWSCTPYDKACGVGVNYCAEWDAVSSVSLWLRVWALTLDPPGMIQGSPLQLWTVAFLLETFIWPITSSSSISVYLTMW